MTAMRPVSLDTGLGRRCIDWIVLFVVCLRCAGHRRTRMEIRPPWLAARWPYVWFCNWVAWVVLASLALSHNICIMASVVA